MGKKNKPSSSLGRSLIKDRFGRRSNLKFVGDNSMLHTTEVQDGYDWGRLNLQSVTEESSFQEFLSTAELAGTEYKAEKLNIKFVNPRSNVGLLSKDEKKIAEQKHEQSKDLLKIPRRPSWTPQTTPEELDQNEREHFLNWRKSLVQLQEEEGILLTPYEKNLEFWRQLWRVVERSDVVVQIVDARNPLLFICEDLAKYVKEVSEHKLNIILLNKADFLTEKQRQYWADYFSSMGIHVAFFSATLASEKDTIIEEDEKDEEVSGNEENDRTLEESEVNKNVREEIKSNIQKLELAVEESAQKLSEVTGKIEKMLNEMTGEPQQTIEKEGASETSTDCDEKCINNSSELLCRDGLINLFKTIHEGPKVTSGLTTIGLVGYPNVGKSSTINALLTYKKVSVSATPGKTKHFQTIFLDRDLLLCDCPGLVMPSFVFTKAEMIVNGILPIDQMRDHVPPINLISSLIPRHLIEDKYGIMLPQPMEGEDPNRCPTAEEILNAYAFNRGFMTANGQPDNPRAARLLLKDFMNGKLLYVHAPPGIQYSDYNTWPERRKQVSTARTLTPREARAIKSLDKTPQEVDEEFNFSRLQVHVKGQSIDVVEGSSKKPWKELNKHKNKKKKEKLRRVYQHLDQH